MKKAIFDCDDCVYNVKPAKAVRVVGIEGSSSISSCNVAVNVVVDTKSRCGVYGNKPTSFVFNLPRCRLVREYKDRGEGDAN